jgi:hypothetical protein
VKEAGTGAFDFHRDLIHPPGIGRGFQMRSAALLQFGGILLDPAKDRRMIDTEPALSHHLFEVTIAQRIPQGVSVRTAECSQLQNDAL